jgi:hypothetical protein
MLRKVNRIKLGPRIYRRLMKKLLERNSWRCQKCAWLLGQTCTGGTPRAYSSSTKSPLAHGRRAKLKAVTTNRQGRHLDWR